MERPEEEPEAFARKLIAGSGPGLAEESNGADPVFSLPSRAIRAMEFAAELRGIRRRYRRCRQDWEPHLRRTRDLILRSAARAASHRKAVILGAGLLHDIPWQELAELFQQVVLVDVLHPWRSRWQTRRFANVHHLRADVTGTLVDVYRLAWDADLPLPRSQPTLFLDDPTVDFVASVNLLSQLPCLPTRYLRRQGAHSSSTIDQYARDLIQAHMTYLDRMPGQVALITDCERLKITLLGQVVERKDLFLGIPWPEADEEWEWRLAPCPEADPRHHYFRRVIGIVDWKLRRQSPPIH